MILDMEFPDSVDLVVVGTGLPESIIACAAARAGKSVLVLDANNYYGSSWATLNLEDFMEWHERHANPGDTPPVEPCSETAIPIFEDHEVVQNLSSTVIGHELTGTPKQYGIDLAHKACQCTGEIVQAVRKLGLSSYMDFVHVQSSHVWMEGGLRSVPASKGSIFSNTNLNLREKRALMRFMQEVEKAVTHGVSGTFFDTPDLKSALDNAGLPPRLQEILLYAIIQAPSPVLGDRLLDGKLALEAIEAYTSQVGTYVEDQAPYIEVTYGNSEIMQGFCRACCVKGGLTALRQPATSVLLQDGRVTGVRTGSGHTIKCDALACTASWLTAFRSSPPPDDGSSSSQNPERETASKAKPSSADQPVTTSGSETTATQRVAAPAAVRRGRSVARAICLTDAPIQQGTHNVQVVFPPGACGNPNTVFCWQCDPALQVCPEGKYLLHLAAQAGPGAARNELEGCLEALVLTPEQRAHAEEASKAAELRGAAGDDAAASCPAPASQDAPCPTTQDSAPPSANPDHARQAGADQPAQASDAPTGTSAAFGGSLKAASPRAEDPPRGRPRASVVCYFNQAVYEEDEFELPANAVACPLPDHTCVLDSAVVSAAAAFSRLFPESPFLADPPSSADEELRGDPTEDGSDLLAAALKALDGKANGEQADSGAVPAGTPDVLPPSDGQDREHGDGGQECADAASDVPAQGGSQL